MNNNIFGTPEPSLSVELRSMLDRQNLLTTNTKRKDLLDDHISKDDERNMALKRKNIVEEIYSSEKSYLKQLNILLTFFKAPMEHQNMAPIHVLNSLFGNIEAIYNVNKDFMRRLEEDKNNVVNAFIITAPFFKMYSAYAYNYKNVLNMLESMPKSNSVLHDFICQQETRPEVGAKISSLLIAPVQRIPRYLLLLKELHSLTPELSSAYSTLAEAIKEIGNIVDHIEGLMKKQENMSRMIFIQRCLLNGKPNIIAPGRQLIREGKLNKVVKNTTYPRYMVLLNDMILYCKDWTGSSLKCLRVLPLNKCVINGIGFKKGVFSLQCQSFSVVLCTDDESNQGQEWIEAIQSSIDAYKQDKKSLRKLSSNRRPLQRKEFNSLDEATDLRRKRRRKNSCDGQENLGDLCLISPWKKLKPGVSTDDIHKSEESARKEMNSSIASTSYLKKAKQFLLSMKLPSQKMNDGDSSSCQSVSTVTTSTTD